MWNRNEAVALMNEWGKAKMPFLFFTDFLGEKIWLKLIEEVIPEELIFDFNGRTNAKKFSNEINIHLEKSPVSVAEFSKAFDGVVREIKYGNSFLTNLTFETPILLSESLHAVFSQSKAKYKLCFCDQFVCFSPETFVTIHGSTIRSFPMKGTIDARLPNAKQLLLNDPKEIAEHITIVDLIRNDLGMVGRNVRVERFRYLDEIKTKNGSLLQVSSEIVGELPENWNEHMGDILFTLLPAGSICGAPKPKTVEIILKTETHQRGFYTGICGLFNGESLDSGVMIRYIEKRGSQHYYKSGGGITAFSDADKEYQEYQDKIYVPV